MFDGRTRYVNDALSVSGGSGQAFAVRIYEIGQGNVMSEVFPPTQVLAFGVFAVLSVFFYPSYVPPSFPFSPLLLFSSSLLPYSPRWNHSTLRSSSHPLPYSFGTFPILDVVDSRPLHSWRKRRRVSSQPLKLRRRYRKPWAAASRGFFARFFLGGLKNRTRCFLIFTIRIDRSLLGG